MFDEVELEDEARECVVLLRGKLRWLKVATSICSKIRWYCLKIFSGRNGGGVQT
jgi:hypothetical protein